MEPVPPTADSSQPKCRDCGGLMWRLGTEQFRVAGTSGLWNLMSRQGIDMGAEMLAFEVTVCPACRHVELRVPSGAAETEERVPGLRYACAGCGGDVYQGQEKCPDCGYDLKVTNPP